MKELLLDIWKAQGIDADPAPFEKYSELLLSANEVMTLKPMQQKMMRRKSEEKLKNRI